MEIAKSKLQKNDEFYFTVFHSEPVIALRSVTVWSPWGNQGMAKCRV